VNLNKLIGRIWGGGGGEKGGGGYICVSVLKKKATDLTIMVI